MKHKKRGLVLPLMLTLALLCGCEGTVSSYLFAIHAKSTFPSPS